MTMQKRTASEARQENHVKNPFQESQKDLFAPLLFCLITRCRNENEQVVSLSRKDTRDKRTLQETAMIELN